MPCHQADRKMDKWTVGQLERKTYRITSCHHASTDSPNTNRINVMNERALKKPKSKKEKEKNPPPLFFPQKLNQVACLQSGNSIHIHLEPKRLPLNDSEQWNQIKIHFRVPLTESMNQRLNNAIPVRTSAPTKMFVW